MSDLPTKEEYEFAKTALSYVNSEIGVLDKKIMRLMQELENAKYDRNNFKQLADIHKTTIEVYESGRGEWDKK